MTRRDLESGPIIFPIKPRFQWRHQYDNARDAIEGNLAGLECKDESLTVQSFAQDADLNIIAKRFGINAIPSTPVDPAHYRDTTNDPELRDILEAQRTAKDHFLNLPAKIRKRFHNNPAELWSFINDPENAEEAVRLGLLKHHAPTADGSATSTATSSTDAKTTAAPKEPPKGSTEKTEGAPNAPSTP